MRRVRKVIVAVDPAFYESLERGRSSYYDMLKKRAGVTKGVKMSFPFYTSYLAQKIDFSKFHDAKQKRRR